MNSKKSQASVEFLATYGWMLILTLGVIAALAKYNVIGTDILSTKSDVCKIYSSINCLGAVWKGDVLELSISNDAQTDLGIRNISIKDKLNRFDFSWVPQVDSYAVRSAPDENCNDVYTEEYCLIYKLDGGFYSGYSLNLTKNSVFKITLFPNDINALQNVKNFEGEIQVNYFFKGSKPSSDTHTAKGYISIKRQD